MHLFLSLIALVLSITDLLVELINDLVDTLSLNGVLLELLSNLPKLLRGSWWDNLVGVFNSICTLFLVLFLWSGGSKLTNFLVETLTKIFLLGTIIK